MYVTRNAQATVSPISIRCAVMYGNASLERSAGEIRASSSRDRGPWTLRTAQPAVTSVAVQRASGGMWRSAHSRSRSWSAAALRTMKRVSSRRVTVTSPSIPPRSLSHCV